MAGAVGPPHRDRCARGGRSHRGMARLAREPGRPADRRAGARPGAAFLAVVVVQQVHDLGRGWDGFDRVDESLRLAEGLALIAVALGVAWQRFAARESGTGWPGWWSTWPTRSAPESWVD